MTISEFNAWFPNRFRKTSSAPTAIAFVLSDLAGVMFSFGLGFLCVESYGWLTIGDGSLINLKSFVTYWPYLPVFFVIFQILGLYPGISLAPSEELRRLFLGSAISFGWIVFSRFIENGNVWNVVNTAFAFSVVFAAPVLLVVRGMVHFFLRKTGIGGIPAVVFGSGKTAMLTVDKLLDDERSGYVPALILDNEKEGLEEYRGIPIIHDTSIGPEIVERHNIKMAIVAIDKQEPDQLRKLLNNSVSAFRYRVLIPEFFDSSSIWMSVMDFNGLLGFAMNNRLRMPWNLFIKRLLDILVVIIGGIIISPILLIVAILVKITSPGPVLYGHERLGKNGKPFRALKFRSMASNAEQRLQRLLASDPAIREEWEREHKLRNDPRVTKLGKFLRHTSLDEFPQFINILKGEMSFVGPRPVTREETAKYGDDFAWIFSAKPGLTGLWQVSGRSGTDYAARVSYDTYYLQSWSVWLDVWIIYKTFGVVFRGKGAY